MNKVKKIDMVILMQHDLAAAVEFYKNLGLHLKFHMQNKWAEFDLDGVKVGLCPTSDKIDRRTGIVLQVENLREVYDALKDTVSFLNEPFEAVHGVMVSFKDPGGNILDLYQPTPEKVDELVKKTVEKGCGKKGGCGCKKQNGSSCSTC